MSENRDAQGSRWHRWDPHIHTPETIRNNSFNGSQAWDEYLRRIENADPPIRALGITDYYCLESYETVLEKKRQGRLPGVELIFANVEMRYGIGLSKGAINVHLLVSPEDPDH